jgi:hypothetical protein
MAPLQQLSHFQRCCTASIPVVCCRSCPAHFNGTHSLTAAGPCDIPCCSNQEAMSRCSLDLLSSSSISAHCANRSRNNLNLCWLRKRSVNAAVPAAYPTPSYRASRTVDHACRITPLRCGAPHSSQDLCPTAISCSNSACEHVQRRGDCEASGAGAHAGDSPRLV